MNKVLTSTVITLRQLRKSYDDLEVLRGVDLTAREGDVISLIGSSGSGKSTLLRCINMLEICQGGDIEFCGEPVAWRGQGAGRLPADRKQVIAMRTQLSMVFQQFNLWAHMSVLSNVIEAPVTVLGRPRDEMVDEAMQLLAKVGIADKADSYPAQLSGGQQQRAAIARALAMRPTFLLLDEPLAGIDPIALNDIRNLIVQLKMHGLGVLITDHNVRETLDIVDRAYIIHDGTVLMEGTPDEVIGHQGVRQVYLGDRFSI